MNMLDGLSTHSNVNNSLPNIGSIQLSAPHESVGVLSLSLPFRFFFSPFPPIQRAIINECEKKIV